MCDHARPKFPDNRLRNRLIFIWEDVADSWMKRASDCFNQIILVGVNLTRQDFRNRGVAIAG